eukprot:2277498-Prymnesium_polylepis.1
MRGPSGGLGASAGSAEPGSSSTSATAGHPAARLPLGARVYGRAAPTAALHRAHGRRKGGYWRKSTRKPLLSTPVLG